MFPSPTIARKNCTLKWMGNLDLSIVSSSPNSFAKSMNTVCNLDPFPDPHMHMYLFQT